MHFYNDILVVIWRKIMPGSPSLVGRAPGNYINHKARSRKGSRVQISLPAPLHNNHESALKL